MVVSVLFLLVVHSHMIYILYQFHILLRQGITHGSLGGRSFFEVTLVNSLRPTAPVLAPSAFHAASAAL